MGSQPVPVTQGTVEKQKESLKFNNAQSFSSFLRPAFPSSATDSDPIPEVWLTGSSGGRGGLLVRDDGQDKIVRPPDSRSWRNKGELGRIVDVTMDMRKLRAMDVEYLSPMDVILDEVSFLRQILSNAKLPSARKVSRWMSHHETTLTDFGIFRRRRNDEGPCGYSMALFTVLKKNGELRLIQDCRPLNKIFNKPPPMDLPRIHDLVDEVLSNEFVGAQDAVSMFYQFALSDEIQKYFAVLLAGPRGALVEGRMTRMSMGFSWAPCIAQRSSNVLIRGLGCAWVDNFFVLGSTRSEFEANRAEFLRRTREVGMQLDSEDFTPCTVLSALGVEFDLCQKRYRMDDEWAQKATAKVKELVSSSLSIQGLYEISGTLIWRNHVMRRKLCHVPYLLEALSSSGSSVAKGTKKWSDDFVLSAELRQEILQELTFLETNAWSYKEERSPPAADIWTDSSLTYAAYVICHRNRIVDAYREAVPPQHIFYSELGIAVKALQRAHKLGFNSVNLFIDNAAAGICVERGASSNFAANRILTRLPPQETHVHWVPTDTELADQFTRRKQDGTLQALPSPGTACRELTRVVRADPRVCALGTNTF